MLFSPVPAPKVLRSVPLTHFGRAEPFSRVLTDGSRIYFAERMGGTWGLAFVPEHGGEPGLISTSVDRVILYDVDRTRSRLLIGEQRPVSLGQDPLWVVPTSGGSARRVGNIGAGDAAWSPDGQRIVFCQEGELFTVADDGSQPRKLFSVQGVIEHLRWSPDGKRLSFSVRGRDTLVALWEIGADGSNPHPIDFGWKSPNVKWGAGECCGDWSPDGRYFVFRSLRDNLTSLWAIRLKVGRFHRGPNTPVQLYTSPDFLGQPRFSADLNFSIRRWFSFSVNSTSPTMMRGENRWRSWAMPSAESYWSKLILVVEG